MPTMLPAPREASAQGLLVKRRRGPTRFARCATLAPARFAKQIEVQVTAA
ncbi:MAG TPA: hypothetical protein VF896_17660 [Anaerolineales bacterium]